MNDDSRRLRIRLRLRCRLTCRKIHNARITRELRSARSWEHNFARFSRNTADAKLGGGVEGERA
jgi:hypothetical protein